MKNVILITKALAYIEDNLTNDIKTTDMVKELYCSKSLVEKLFRYATNMSIRDYIIRRRMSKAAKDIMALEDVSLLDIAFKYGYGSNEAFTRAFKNVWHVSPSEYRNFPVRCELFPALNFETELMEDESMTKKKKVDISELYDLLKERKNCYFVGVDIKSLCPINDISHEAGDIAILTALNRLEKASGDDDIVFRIGGDEFVALTNSEDSEYAKNIVYEIISHNGEPIKYKEMDIPLSLHATYYKLNCKNIRYAELFSHMQNELDSVKLTQ